MINIKNSANKEVKKFVVEITETLQTQVDVYAETKEDALKSVSKSYDDGEIVLDFANYIDHEIKLIND